MGRPTHTRLGGRTALAGDQVRIMANIDATVGVEPCTVIRQTGSKRFNVESTAGPGTRNGVVYLISNNEPLLGEGYLRVMAAGVDEGGGLKASATLEAVSAAVSATGAGYVVADSLTVTGGTQTQAAIFDVNDLSTIVGQTEADFTVFVGGDGAGGTAHVALDVLTLTDGTTVRVDTIDGSDDVLTFTVLTASTSGVVGDNTTIAQASSTGSGTAFTMTMETATQGVFDVTSSATDGNYTVIPTNPAAHSGGTGTGATLTVAYGIHATITVVDGGDDYTGTPVLEITGDGTGATATSTTNAGAINAISRGVAGTGYTSPPSVVTNIASILFADRLGSRVVKTSDGQVLKMVSTGAVAGEAVLDVE